MKSNFILPVKEGKSQFPIYTFRFSGMVLSAPCDVSQCSVVRALKCRLRGLGFESCSGFFVLTNNLFSQIIFMKPRSVCYDNIQETNNFSTFRPSLKLQGFKETMERIKCKTTWIYMFTGLRKEK